MKTATNTLVIGCLLVGHFSFAQLKNNLETKELKVEETTFYYHHSNIDSKAAVILFHDWFGVSDLSYEMAERITSSGMNVYIIDLYKGKSAKTNQEAQGLMNTIDQGRMWYYIDQVLKEAKTSHEKIYLWGFSLGTFPASETAIRNNEAIDALVLFYGNVTQDKERLKKIDFPTLMVMGAKDNPQGAIDYYKNVTEVGGSATLFIYPNARHAFAQKLFNAGGNYDENAKEASLDVAFRFLEEIK